MAGLWSYIKPETAAITNLVTNPSIETATTGFTAVGGSVAADTTKQRRGYRSLKITPTASTTDGVYYGTVSLTSGTTYTFSVDIWGVNGIPYKIYFASTAGVLKGTATTFTGSAQWSRQSVSWACDSTTTYRLYVVKNTSASTADFYIDGLVVAALDHATGYIDGDQKDCEWNGTKHASTSTRAAYSVHGGEAINFDDLSFFIEDFPGTGMAEIEALTQDIGSLPGSLDAGEKTLDRTFALVGTLIGTSQTDLHAKRKALIDALKSDRVKGKKPLWIVYSGVNSTRPVRIFAKYTGGLTLNRLDGFSERVALKFLATDPYWYEDGVEGAALTYEVEVANADYVIRQVDGDWYNISTDIDSYVVAIEKLNGCIYLGGYFTDVGSANGDYALKWDGSSLSALGTSPLAGGECWVIKKSPAGLLYFGGAFTSADGDGDCARICCYNPTTNAFSPLGTGIGSDMVKAIAIGNDGIIYAGGGFTNHVDANGDNITQFDGTNWSSLSTGMNGSVYALIIGPDGYLYAGGGFTIAGGVTVNAVAKWDGSAWTALGSGITRSGGGCTVYALAFDEAGNLYAGGEFDTAGGISAANVAKWNGTSWEALGTGTNNYVRRVAYANGLFYIGGYFITAGGIALADGVAVWNGSTWSHINVDIPGSGTTIHMIYADDDDLYIAGNFTGTALASYKNSITNNGTAIAFPKIVIKRSGGDALRVVYIKNEQTGATLWLDYAMLDGETLTIDTAIDQRTIISDYRGNVIGSALLRNSDFSDFYLLPGDNDISVFCHRSGSPSNVCYATWPLTHWSLDGSAV